jgi:ferredoxin-NADP reductase
VQQIELIKASDTLFIGSGQHERTHARANGYDASHRGGKAGFVQVVDNTHLRIPDYAGNNFFNTIGNLLNNPKVALLFIDFKSGSLLHLSGEASIDWDPTYAQSTSTTDSSAQRFIDITIHAVIERPGALGLRWQSQADAARQLTLLKKVPESESITSFYLAATDNRPLAPYKAGQHLPVTLQLPQPHGKVTRTYSLSAASNGETYRLSIKREAQGLISRFMHDTLAPGDTIEAGTPTGEFTLPAQQTPVVLVSAGVGITPLLAMLEEISLSGGNHPVWFLHSARNGSVHALGEAVRALTSADIKTQVYYTQPGAEDRLGVDFDVDRRITTEDLLNLNAGSTAHYLLCGPVAFVATLQSGLETAGVPISQIHFETF